jgi:hypothetical protein
MDVGAVVAIFVSLTAAATLIGSAKLIPTATAKAFNYVQAMIIG